MSATLAASADRGDEAVDAVVECSAEEADEPTGTTEDAVDTVAECSAELADETRVFAETLELETGGAELP